MEAPDFTKYNSTISPTGARSAEAIPMYDAYQVKMFIIAAFQYAHDVHYHNVPYDPQKFFEYYNLNK